MRKEIAMFVAIVLILVFVFNLSAFPTTGKLSFPEYPESIGFSLLIGLISLLIVVGLMAKTQKPVSESEKIGAEKFDQRMELFRIYSIPFKEIIADVEKIYEDRTQYATKFHKDPTPYLTKLKRTWGFLLSYLKDEEKDLEKGMVMTDNSRTVNYHINYLMNKYSGDVEFATKLGEIYQKLENLREKLSDKLKQYKK